MAGEIIAVILLAVHLLSIQLASAGPVMAIFLEWRSRRALESAAGLYQAAERMAKHSLWAFVLGIVAGIGLGWLAVASGHRDYSIILRRFHSRLWWGIWEMVFSGAVLSVYLWVFPRFQSLGRSSRWIVIVHRGLAIITVTNLLYHFPPLLSVIVDQMGVVDSVEKVNSAEFRSLIFAPEIVAKTIHFSFASLAVAGAWAMISTKKRDAGNVRIGAWVATVALVAQMLTGGWLVMQASPLDRSRLMGADVITSAFLMASIVCSMLALNQTASVAMGDTRTKQVIMATATIVLVILLMVVVSARLGGLVG